MTEPNFAAFEFRVKTPQDRAKEALLAAVKLYEGMSQIYDRNPDETNWVRLNNLHRYRTERQQNYETMC